MAKNKMHEFNPWELFDFTDCKVNHPYIQKSDITKYGIKYIGVFPTSYKANRSLSAGYLNDVYYEVTITIHYDMYKMIREEMITDPVPFKLPTEFSAILHKDDAHELRNWIKKKLD